MSLFTAAGIMVGALNKFMIFSGVIIEESLTDKSVLGDVKIVKTNVEPVTEEHKTP